MTQQQVVNRIIDKIAEKANEHLDELQRAAEELKSMKKEKTIESATKHMVLKDKIMFHKACSMALKQVLEEVSEEIRVSVNEQ